MGNSHDVSAFTQGEEINPNDHDIRIKITNIDRRNNTLEAVVIKAEGHFSTTRGAEKGHPQGGFQVGMELVFEQTFPNSWTPHPKKIRRPSNIPWFDLTILDDGTKRFEHYR